METGSRLTRLAAAVALAVFGGAAHASVLNLTASGGSEAVLTITNSSNASTISQDIGDQIGQLAIGDSFALDSSVLSFISGAGGLGGVKFALVAGQAASGSATAAGLYLTSSPNAAFSAPSAGGKGTWFSTANNFYNQLNGTNPSDLDPNVDAAYGAFASGASGNFLSGSSTGTDFMADWGQSGTCPVTTQCDLVGGVLSAALYRVAFSTSVSAPAAVTKFLDNGLNGGALARLDLANGLLRIEAVNAAVPVPAAVWLMGSAVGLMGLVRRRQNVA
jgi:hypothetical protein